MARWIKRVVPFVAAAATASMVVVGCSDDEGRGDVDDDDGGAGSGAAGASGPAATGGGEAGAGPGTGGSTGEGGMVGAGGSPGSGGAPPVGCGPDGVALINAINQYRSDNGLGPIPTSPSMCTVAEAHVNDLRDHAPHNAPGCNLHSWSDQGAWSACCYTSDHAQAQCMWDKPSELTSYGSNGYEISYSGPDNPQSAVNAWSTSNGHNAVILNLGSWANQNWQAIGAAQHDGYAHVWFGTASDP